MTETSRTARNRTFLKTSLLTMMMIIGGQALAQEQAEEKKSAWNFLPDAVKEGKINVNSLLRWEWADQESFGGDPAPKESNAFTIRNRVGFTTGSLYNFKSMIEFEDVTIIGNENNYNQAGINPAVLAAPSSLIRKRPKSTELGWPTKTGTPSLSLDANVSPLMALDLSGMSSGGKINKLTTASPWSIRDSQTSASSTATSQT
ncbi:MAG: hypothetical protein M2R45_03373 [Verrucomicrobia subdivision 3 bacterium]|nr:hypothetical protein [Limisphaerales bacterium]MCS1416714.1 hypothetical protein [Limisphaerales bacterium]